MKQNLQLDSLDSLRAITLQQPWGYWCGRRKFKETRSQPRYYQGWLAIHTSQKFDKTLQQFAKRLEEQLGEEGEYQTGVIISICWMDGCTKMSEEFINEQSPDELLLGLWNADRYAYTLSNFHFLEKSVKAKGQQSIIWTPSADVISQIKENIRC